MHVNHWVQNAEIRRIRHITCFSCLSCFSYCRFSASSNDSSATFGLARIVRAELTKFLSSNFHHIKFDSVTANVAQEHRINGV